MLSENITENKSFMIKYGYRVEDVNEEADIVLPDSQEAHEETVMGATEQQQEQAPQVKRTRKPRTPKA